MTYFRVLTISLGIHILLAMILSLVVPPVRLNTKPPTFVELMEKPQLARRPHQNPRDEQEFVRSAQAPKQLLIEEKKKARFASEDEQNVLEEQRARLNDLTANRTADGSKTAQKAQTEIKKPGPKSKVAKDLNLSPTSALEQAKERLLAGKAPNAPGDIRVGGLRPPKVTNETPAEREGGEGGQPAAPSFGGAEKGFSTVGEQLPNDIKFGDFTALNTDRHLFYSFYARMEEKIRYRWVTYARAAIYNVSPAAMKTAGKEVYVTKLEVVLDPQGHYVRSILHEGSGMQSLDDAPVQAFRDAGQFPNPPPEMIKEDGYIHIYYGFSVNMIPSNFAGRN